MTDAIRDGNHVPVNLGVSSTDNTVTLPFVINSVTGKLKVETTGDGDVVGPSSSTDKAIVRFSGTTGKLIQDSLVTIDDTGHILAVDGTGANPSYRFGQAIGFYRFGSSQVAYTGDGNANIIFSNTGTFVSSTLPLGWGTPSSTDLTLLRLAAGQLIVRQDATHGVALDVATDGTLKVLSRAGADTAILTAKNITATPNNAASGAILGFGSVAGFSHSSGDNSIGVWVNSARSFSFGANSAGFLIRSDYPVAWSSTTDPLGALDLVLSRASAGVLKISSTTAGTASVSLTVPATGTANVIPVTVGGPSGRLTAQTAAQTLSTYTVGAADGTFNVSANINVTTSTTHTFTVTCVYTDETNASRTLTFGFTQLSGATFITAITNITGAGPYESPLYHIRCKAATTITIATTGTFTSVTYNGEGYITQKG